MTAHLSLSTLGVLKITLDQLPITGFESNKVRSLLAYLVVENQRPFSRDFLAGLLWPEFSNRAALNNLRYALSNLRKVIGDRDSDSPFLLVTTESIQFNPESNYDLDVQTLIETIESNDIEHLSEVVKLFRGEFLEGLIIKDSAAFEEWVLAKREQVHRKMLMALRHLADHYEGLDEYEQAQQYAWRLVELEPWQEEVHQQLMRLLAFSGQRSAALTQYETCCRLLADELGVEPSAETTSLYQRIAAGILAVPTHRPAIPAFLESNTEPAHLEPPLFVARETELAKLDVFLRNALAGRGRVAFITGEPGSGKTMLFQEFARRVLASHSKVLIVNGNSNAYTGIGDPYLPFVEMLEMLAGELEMRWSGGAVTTAQARRLWQSLPEVVDILVDDGPELIDRFVSGANLAARARSGAPSQLAKMESFLESKAKSGGTGSLQQVDLFEQYTKVLKRLSKSHPLVLFADDLQWADAGSISLLFHLGRRLPGHRILLLGAYRSGEVAAGRDGGRHPLEAVLHELQRDYGDNQVDLSKAEGRKWMESLLDTEPNRLGEDFRATLFRHTNGHALFTVELLRGLQERGDLVKDEAGRWMEGAALNWEALPPRVEAVIAESICRLPEAAQSILSAASVEGEIFPAQAVSRVQAMEDQEVIQILSGPLSKLHRLVSAAGFQRVGEGQIAVYRFRHFLFQKYLYNRLDEVERARLHEAMGKALEELYGAASPQIALQLARHFELSGLTERAVKHLQLAGEQATWVYANVEAISHYRRALDLLQTLPDTTERANLELRLRLGLSVPLQATRGFGDSEVEQNFSRARDLTRQSESTPELFQALLGLKGYYDLRGSLHTALELAEYTIRLAEKSGDPQLQTLSWHSLSTTVMYLGRFKEFLEYRKRSHELYNRELHRNMAIQFGYDSEVAGLSHASWTLWFLGYPEQAKQISAQAQSWANELGHPYMITWAKFFAAQLHCYMREVAMTRKLSEETIALSQQTGSVIWLAGASSLINWTLEEDQIEEAIRGQEDILAVYRKSGSEFPRLQEIPLLAEAYCKVGKTIEGLTLVEEALNTACSNDLQILVPDLFRSKGELLLISGESDAEAEACFQQSIEAARQHEAKSWELRAALSLCRLWQRQGKPGDAYKLLATIYNWFTEGFDTPDLIEARHLLDELMA